jgi:hypothetical protein
MIWAFLPCFDAKFVKQMLGLQHPAHVPSRQLLDRVRDMWSRDRHEYVPSMLDPSHISRILHAPRHEMPKKLRKKNLKAKCQNYSSAFSKTKMRTLKLPTSISSAPWEAEISPAYRARKHVLIPTCTSSSNKSHKSTPKAEMSNQLGHS